MPTKDSTRGWVGVIRCRQCRATSLHKPVLERFHRRMETRVGSRCQSQLARTCDIAQVLRAGSGCYDGAARAPAALRRCAHRPAGLLCWALLSLAAMRRNTLRAALRVCTRSRAGAARQQTPLCRVRPRRSGATSARGASSSISHRAPPLLCPRRLHMRIPSTVAVGPGKTRG